MFCTGKRHNMCPFCLTKHQNYKSIQYQQIHSYTIMYFTPN
jgi:uncharacterized OB-fold protein